MGERFHLFAKPRTRGESVLVRTTAACAVAVPYLVGAAVKIRLDLLGKPTLSWLDGAVGMVAIVVSSGVGWILLTLPFRYAMHRWADEPDRIAGVERAWAGALLGGAAALACTLYGLLQVAANAALVAVLAPWWYWWWTLGGGCAGAVLALCLAWAAPRGGRARPRFP